MTPSILARSFLLSVVVICCLLPLAWMAVTIATHPAAVLELQVDSFRLRLLLRTLALAAGAAGGAVALGLPGALLIGRSRRGAAAVWAVMPLPVLVPTLVLTYAWTMALDVFHARPVPQSFLDEARCMAVLATWLWPVAAGIMGVTLRRTDAAVLEQAALDGIVGRLVARQLVAPGVASFLICCALASQEFSIFEPTGISVIATEIRMVFETGAFSGPNNPIATLQGGTTSGELTTDQPQRAAAALATGLPAVFAAIALTLAGVWLARRAGSGDESAETRPPSRAVGLSWPATIGAAAVVGVLVVAPILVLALMLRARFEPWKIYEEYAPRLWWSVALAGAAGAIATLVALSATVAKPWRWVVALGVLAFLVGGQFLAIATIRIYNVSPAWLPHRWSPQSLILRSDAALVLAYLGRFVWLAILLGGSTWGPGWKSLRDLAAADGADRWQTARHVIFPLAWPALLSAGVLVGVLSLAEVPATALLAPLTLVPMLLTWVHQLRSDPMIEASLLIVAVVGGANVLIVGLGRMFFRGRRI